MATLDQTVNRSAFSVGRVEEQSADYRSYWQTKTPEERIAAIEFLRHTQFGEQAATRRLQRVLEVSQRRES